MKLNLRDIEVLKILNMSETALTCSQIVNKGMGLTQSTVQAVIRKLLADELVEVQNFTYSGNVLSRAFGATKKSKERIKEYLVAEFEGFSNLVDRQAVVAGLFRAEDDISKKRKDVEEIERFLEKLKEELE